MTELELQHLVSSYQSPSIEGLPILSLPKEVTITETELSMYEDAKSKSSLISTKALEWLRFQISAKNMLLTGYERRQIPSDNIYVLTTKAERLALNIILDNIETTPEQIVIAQLYFQHDFAHIINQSEHSSDELYTAKKQIDVYRALVYTLGTWRSYLKIGDYNE